eukprot:TRINITY_DN11718_c0_g1_i1.p1 TRINITY_DN11718_c0_g1~~TRINITY_DN11718_c0_g1_i1.p1  ORF type:complete len:222 (+),score=12.55 TRINITY_DN11718_c0_g1_i1:46-666(+)
MAEALRHNTTLQSFAMNAIETSLGDTTVVALKQMLKTNIALQHVVLWIPPRHTKGLSEDIVEAVARNKALHAQRHTLGRLARTTSDTGFRSLKEAGFRRAVFSFFTPALCKLTPFEFSGRLRSTSKDGYAVTAAQGNIVSEAEGVEQFVERSVARVMTLAIWSLSALYRRRGSLCSCNLRASFSATRVAVRSLAVVICRSLSLRLD